MGMSVGGSKGGPQGEINVTPLIDIVLVLLIIFMVMTPILLKELTVNVPKKQDENVPPDATATPIVLKLSATNTLELNQDPVAPEALAEKVAERLKYDRQKVVFFQIDDEASYGAAVRFMDICKGAGAKTLGIMTKDTP